MRRYKHQLASSAAHLIAPFVGNQPARGRRVLMFHGVNDPIVNADPDLYNHKTVTFRQHVDAIQSWALAHRLEFLPFDGASSPGITLTFDDGYASIATTVAPILCERGIPFHVFVPAGLVNLVRTLHLSKDDVRGLSSNPLVGFGAHGLMHRSLTSMPDYELTSELNTSRKALSELTGSDVRSMSYPFGDHDERVHRAARHAGFTYAGTSSPGTCDESTDPMQIPRVDIWAMDSARDVVNKLRGAWDRFL